MKDTLPEAVARRSVAARKANATRKANKANWQEAALADLRKLLASKPPRKFVEGETVRYIAPDGFLGPFTVGIYTEGGVGLWYRNPNFKYRKNDWGHHVHALVEKAQAFPGTNIVKDHSFFTTMGPDNEINTAYLV